MKLKPLILFLLLFLLLTPNFIYAEEGPHIETFSPQGIVKGIRQVTVRFSEPMVPFGDPRGLTEPFAINCPEKGTERWADQKNWIYDFDKNLPAGIRCEFKVKPELKSLSGTPIVGKMNFVFSTGGPAIISSIPFEGSNIDEEQVFILELDADPTDESITSNVSFSIEGIHELVSIRILSEEERKPILEAQYWHKDNKGADKKLVVIQSRQRFPADTKVGLIWGKGVTSKTRVANEQDQKLRFRTRSPFTANFHCQRENKVSDILSDMESRSNTFGLENPLSTRFWSAVKTGTSKDMRDNWCIGYSSKYTVGVWVGNFSGEPMWNVSGITGAAPIWTEIMDWLHRNQMNHPIKPPSGLVAKKVELPQLGSSREEWFIKGTEPIRINQGISYANYKIVYPTHNTIIALDPDIPGGQQMLFFEAQPRNSHLRWLLNKNEVGTAGSILTWRPYAGRFKLDLVDQEDHILDSLSFEVRDMQDT